MPAFSLIDVAVRGLINCYCEPVRIDFDRELTIAKFHRLNCCPRTGKVYHHRPERVVWSKHASGYPIRDIKMQNSLAFDKPPAKLVSDYEAAKKSFLDDWNRKNAKIIADVERSDGKKEKKESTFAKYYALVDGNKKKYATEGKRFLQVSSTKILLKHPDCGIRSADLIARGINAVLKSKREKKPH